MARRKSSTMIIIDLRKRKQKKIVPVRLATRYNVYWTNEEEDQDSGM